MRRLGRESLWRYRRAYGRYSCRISGLGHRRERDAAGDAVRRPPVFREKTQGAWVIVGRKTLADFPGGRPLPNRTTVVLSRSCRSIAGAQVVSSAQEAVRATAGGSPVFVIGGAAVYRSMLPYCSRVYVTRVEACPVSDVFFPNLDRDPDWICTHAGPLCREGEISYRFCVYERSVGLRG